MPRVHKVPVDPESLCWLRRHLAAYVKSGAANGATPKVQRALTTVREICDQYIDGNDGAATWVMLVVKERT